MIQLKFRTWRMTVHLLTKLGPFVLAWDESRTQLWADLEEGAPRDQRVKAGVRVAWPPWKRRVV